MTDLWRILPSSLPQPHGVNRKIKGGPLVDLAALQQAIRASAITDRLVRVVNRTCDDSLENLGWTTQHILDCMLCASPDDFRGSEWCDTTWAGKLPCDAYSVPYDEQGNRRVRGSLEYYLKFSIEEDTLSIQMVRAHLS